MTEAFFKHGVGFQVSYDLPDNAENSAQFVLVALLSGTLSILTGSNYRSQSMNYTALPPIVQRRRNGRAIDQLLQAYEFGCTQQQLVGRTLADNRGFYQELLAEFSQYFAQEKKGAHTAAFIFLYRIIERLFYSVPLLYVSTSKDYSGTFKDLKSLFLDEKTGEHGFFKKFLNQGNFIDSDVLDQVYVLDLDDAEESDRRCAETLNRVFKVFVPAGPTLNQLGCKFRDVPDLLVSIRNRFFHSRTGDGQANISLKALVNPDELFAHVNPIFCSFLTVVTMHSLAKKYRVLIESEAT